MSDKKHTIEIAATFKGLSGTLGYTNDVRYRLTIEELGEGAILVYKERNPSAGAKRYSGLGEFFRSWKDISA
jgi:hypothetical protein